MNFTGCSSSAERSVRDREAEGPIPFTPTKLPTLVKSGYNRFMTGTTEAAEVPVASTDGATAAETAAPAQSITRGKLFAELGVNDTNPWKAPSETSPVDPAAQAEADAAKRAKLLEQLKLTPADIENKPEPPPAPRFPTPWDGAVIPSATRPFTETAAQPTTETKQHRGFFGIHFGLGRNLQDKPASVAEYDAVEETLQRAAEPAVETTIVEPPAVEPPASPAPAAGQETATDAAQTTALPVGPGVEALSSELTGIPAGEPQIPAAPPAEAVVPVEPPATAEAVAKPKRVRSNKTVRRPFKDSPAAISPDEQGDVQVTVPLAEINTPPATVNQ
jgi:hypothetical protein